MGTTTLGIRYPDSTDTYRPDDDMQALAEDVDGLITALPTAWAPYTPTWGSSGSAPSLGNGTIVGRYKADGKKVSVRVKITFGSTSAFGTGAYTMTLPVTAATTVDQVGSGWYRDTSGTSIGHYNGVVAILTSAPTVMSLFEASAHAQVQPTVPVTWANTDFWDLSIDYEVP